MLRNIVQRITKVIKSVRMTDVSPTAVAGQNDKGSKRSLDEAQTEELKKLKTDTEHKPARIPKRKIAMLVGYNGKGYHGIQINRGHRTIEEDIMKALVEVGCIPQDHSETPQKMSFQRAARTDKSVSAVMNILSLKMIIDIENLLEKINSKLVDQIRIFGYRRTTGGFDSKNYCDNRTYMYICPTYAFAPLETIVTDEYRMTDDVLEKVNKVLSRFKGTHKFHNFTSKIQATEQRAKRYIISISCGEPFVRNGCEFCNITVKGQSFMLHQIRKMIGITIAIVRGNCGEDVIDKSWEPERVDIPKAPGLGLCLQQPHYDGYNKKYGNDGLHESLDWIEEKEAVEKFKEEYIISDIIKTEKEEKVMLEWLGTLQIHTFSVEDDPEVRADRYKQRRFISKCNQNPDIVITPDTKEQRKNSASDEEMSEKGNNSTTETNLIEKGNNSCTDDIFSSDLGNVTESNMVTVQSSEDQTERNVQQKSEVKL